MKPILIIISLTVFISNIFAQDKNKQSAKYGWGEDSSVSRKLRLSYTKPADEWSSQALPIGNGFVGAMVFGGVIKDQIQYNEKTLWSGGPGAWKSYQGGNNDSAAAYLPLIRKKITDKDYLAAEELMAKHSLGNSSAFGAFQNFGNIYLDFSSTFKTDSVTGYYRELDLEEGIARVGFTYGGESYLREYFCSYPERVMVIHLKSSKPTGLSFSIHADCAHIESNIKFNNEKNTITTTGRISDNKMGFESVIKIITAAGSVLVEADKLIINNADSVTLILAAATEYKNSYPDYSGNHPHKIVNDIIKSAETKNYQQLADNHRADYKRLFSRVKMQLNGDYSDLPTDVLLKQYKTKPSPYLETLMFQYGRYLLISSSRSGSLPANLQGIWNNSNTPPWNCDYHFDINIQMNYFSAEVTNLTECSDPLIDYINSLRIPGRITAEKHYGVKGRGWVVHPMNNPFGFTAPGWETYWGWAPFNAAWICQNVWDKYRFNGDKKYLRSTIYPIIKEQAQFWQKWLVPDSDGYLVSTPSVSPEHLPISDGPTSDQYMCYELFSDVIEASEILKTDVAFRKDIRNKRKKLLPLKIGAWGQLQEWKYDWDKKDDQHRHVSHLVPIYQGERVNPYTAPQLAEAAKVSLQERDNVKGDVQGWSLTQRMGLWARLLEPEKAYGHLNTLIKGYLTPNLFSLTGGVFQIDANLGVPGMMAELLLQSHLNNIQLLPALPAAWDKGYVSGLCAREGFVVNMKWEKSKLTEAQIYSNLGNDCVVKNAVFNGLFTITNSSSGLPVNYTRVENGISFKTAAGSSYRLVIN